MKWRIDYEDITAKKITEIHQALKMINNATKQNREDLKEKKDALGIELKLVEQNFTNKIGDVKSTID